MILYSIHGEAREIPDSCVDRFLSEGFRRTLPGAAVEPTAPTSAETSLLPVNTASLKDLVSLPLVGTAIAKKIIQFRPYSSIEDLIEKIEGVDWMALESRISF